MGLCVCGADLEAWNAPLVTSRDPSTGAHIDHPSYVSNKGRAGTQAHRET